jgi:hypothetical protein
VRTAESMPRGQKSSRTQLVGKSESGAGGADQLNATLLQASKGI